jgi:hypothetical protein
VKSNALSTDSAPFIAIYWASADLEILETHPLTPGPKSTSVSTTLTETPTTSTSSLPSPASPGLAPGAIAGIAIGVFLVGVVMTALVIWVFIKRRRHAAAHQQGWTKQAAPQLYASGSGSNKLAVAELSVAVTGEPHTIQPQQAYQSPLILHQEQQQQQQQQQPQDFQPQPIFQSPQPTTTPTDIHVELPDHLAQNTATGNVPVEVEAAEVSHTSLTTGMSQATVVGTASDSLLRPDNTQNSPTTVEPTIRDQELEALQQQQAQLDIRRQRLLQLQQLDEEEQRIQQRMSQLGPSSRPN